MIRGKPLLAVTPVRGGSKGIPGKNLKRIGVKGDTLLERAIKFAQGCERVDEIRVSTDDDEMHAIAQRYGVAAPTLRSAQLANDTARTADVIIDLAEQIGFSNGYILLLEATSPLRTRDDLSGFLDRFELDDEMDAGAGICHLRGAHPNKLLSMVDGMVSSNNKAGSDRPRQGMPEFYELNGAFYIIDVDTLRSGRTFLPPKTMGYIMPEERSTNLDTMMDWQIFEAMVAQANWVLEEYD